MSAPRYIKGLRLKTAEYRAYLHMLVRCGVNKGAEAYTLKNYRDRGIYVGEEFLGPDGYDNWYNHIGPKPSPEMLYNRKDNNGPYVYGNIDWASPSESSRNQRKPGSRTYEFGGRTWTADQIAEEVGVSNKAIDHRLYKGQTVEFILRLYGKIS